MLQDLSVIDEVKICPHCQQQMDCCESPPIHVGDGLGWGAEVMFICFNDDCPLYVRGWKQIELQYNHHASYRYMELPGSNESNVMMVGTPEAFKGFVINKQALEAQNDRYKKEKEAVEALPACVQNQDLSPVLALLLDEAANIENRTKAIDYLVPLKDLSCIDPLRNHKFRSENLRMLVNVAIREILALNFKKECPYCMEIIKAQAKKCMHCKADL